MNWRQLIAHRWLTAPRAQGWRTRVIRQMQKQVPQVKDVMWILSSGTQTTDRVKALALTHAGILASAKAVNHHLESDRNDRWLIALPHYHVGGMSIYARAHLSAARVVPYSGKWRPDKFAECVKRQKITLSSLVPTQVHDLVEGEVPCPPSLRAVVIGGGALDPTLYTRARALGWPLLPSYGLTECCSQVATASLASLQSTAFPTLDVLSHVEVELREQRILLRSPALCRWIAVGAPDGGFTLEDPCRAGWFVTEDLAEKQGRGLKILGRRDAVVKILGSLVPVDEVEHQARQFFSALGGSLAVLAVPHARAENELILFTDSQASLRDWQSALQRFNDENPGPRRLRGLCWVPSLPIAELGKIKRAELRQLLA